MIEVHEMVKGRGGGFFSLPSSLVWRVNWRTLCPSALWRQAWIRYLSAYDKRVPPRGRD